jgi:hypothetical protein
MMTIGFPLAAALILLALCAQHLDAQRGRRGGATTGGAHAPTPLRGVVISIHGKLKDLKKKSIAVLADDDKLMTFRRTSKTKFYRDGKEIKPFEIDLESVVTVDVSEDTDLKFLALAVKADPSEKKVLIER